MACMESADVSWMLAGAVQSGAALVAIVGGLLGSRYVALDAEQESARRHLAEVTAQLDPARNRKHQAQLALTRFQVEQMLNDQTCYGKIVEHQGKLTLDQVINTREVEDEDLLAALEKHLAVLLEEFSLAIKRLNPIVPASEQQIPWDAFRRENDLDPRHESLWERMYIRLSYERATSARAAATLGGKFGSLGPPVGDLVQAWWYVGAGVPNAASTTATLNRLIRERDDASLEVSGLEGQMAAARAHVDATGQPQGFALALEVLAYIALVGIAFPLVLMVSAPMALPLGVRIAVAALFLSGVVLLLRYLFVYATYLDHRSSRLALPESVLGLVWPRRSRPPRTGAPKARS